jgi:hypothetical protein
MSGPRSLKGARQTRLQEVRAGCPSASTSDEEIEQAQEMVLAERQVTVDELKISHHSAYQIIHDELGFHEVCAK